MIPFQPARPTDRPNSNVKEDGVDRLLTAGFSCPYCGEQIEILVDGSVARQEYIEDCSVCCRPVVIVAAVADGGFVGIEARTEDE